MKRRVAFLVAFLLLGASGAAAPAPTAPVHAAAGPQQVLAFADVFSALFQRNRVYRNAADVQNELRSYYDGLLTTARAALLDRELALTGSQLAAYRRMVETLEQEKNAALQLLEDDKRGARQTFKNTLNAQLPALLLSMPAARDAAQVLRTNLAEIRDVLQATRAAVVSGRPGALVDIARVRTQLDKYAAVVGLIGGRPGRDLADAVGTVGVQLQQLENAAGSTTSGLEQGIDEADAQVATALERLDQQLSEEVRPTSVSVFGGLHEVQLPAQYAFYAAVAQALSQAGATKHGMTRDAMRDRVRQYLVASQGALIAGTRDCYRAMAAQIRAQLAGAAGREGAAAELLTADLTSCDPDLVAAVLAAAAELEPPASTEATAHSAGTDEQGGTPAGDAADGTDADETAPDQLTGGSVHPVTSDTAGIVVGNSGINCLEYRESRSESIPLILSACTDAADFDVVFDFTAGTVAGTVALELVCPGFEPCWQGTTSATGSVSGTFGPLVYGQKPSTPPADFPFPAHHWSDDGFGDWLAGGPIELAVSISGESTLSDQVASGGASTTITGWVESRVRPASGSSLADVTHWNASIGIRLDFPQDVDPNWYLWTGFAIDLEDPGVELPPWRD